MFKINYFYVFVNGIYNWVKIGISLKRERKSWCVYMYFLKELIRDDLFD